MRRIALFSDIHANLLALDAVLGDIERSGIGERYCLGDLIGYGPDPVGVVERIRETGVPTVLGNYDEGVASRKGSCGCYYPDPEAAEDGAVSYAVTDELLTREAAAWLLGLPREIRLEERGVRLLLVHGSPRKINEYLMLDRSERQLARLAAQAGADVVCHGHIHTPYHRSFEVWDAEGATGAPGADAGASELPVVHYVSSGSVGKPKDSDARAAWVELVLGEESEVREAAAEDPAAARTGTTAVWAGIRVHRVPYDVDSVADAMAERGLPERLRDALWSA